MKEIKLTENQFEKLVNNIQQIQFHEQELEKLRSVQNDFISLICEFNKVEYKDIKINLDAENKKLTIEG